MNKNLLTPLILLAVLLGLAGVAYWDEKKTVSDKTAEEQKGKLFAFDPAEIVSLEVTNLTAEPKSWTLSKVDKSWKVTAPIAYPADAEGIDRLLKIILDAKAEREFASADRPLSAFGLEPAQIVYSLKDLAGKTHKFSIGGKAPTGFSSYAQHNSDPKIFLVNQYLFTATNKTLTDFRDKKIGVPAVSEIKSIDVTFADQAPIRLEKQGEEWKVAAPLSLDADSLDTKKWIMGWDDLRVADFIDNPHPDLRKALTVNGKGTKEVARIRFDTGALQKEFRIVENNEKVYSQLSEQTFVELDKPSIESLRRTPKEFEDRSVFKFVSADVARVTIDGSNYVKVKDDWLSEKDKAAMPFIQSLVVSLEFAKADSKLDSKEAEPSMKGPALHTVEIFEGQKPGVAFSLWKKVDGEGMFVLKTGDSYFQVNSEFVDLLKPRAPSAERASSHAGHDHQ